MRPVTYGHFARLDDGSWGVSVSSGEQGHIVHIYRAYDQTWTSKLLGKRVGMRRRYCLHQISEVPSGEIIPPNPRAGRNCRGCGLTDIAWVEDHRNAWCHSCLREARSAYRK